MRVKVKDFNCITEAEILLEPGLTVLQGESNGGKSSLFRAIENTIFNQSGTTNVRHGCNHYIVGIENGTNKVMFKKGKAGSVYKVNDVEYSKTGVGQLDQVADALGIRETVLAGEKVRLNFWGQMRYPFLLDRSPGQLYKFIVDSSESESLSSVLKDMAKDVKDLNAEVVAQDIKLDVLTAQRLDFEKKLDGSEGIDAICYEIVAMDSVDKVIQRMESLSHKYMGICDSLVQMRMSYAGMPDVNIDGLDDAYSDFKVVDVVKRYMDMDYELSVSRDSLLSVSGRLDVIGAIGELDLGSLDVISGLISRYRTVDSEKDVLCSSLVSIDNELLSVRGELAEFDVCPLCGSDIVEGGECHE